MVVLSYSYNTLLNLSCRNVFIYEGDPGQLSKSESTHFLNPGQLGK